MEDDGVGSKIIVLLFYAIPILIVISALKVFDINLFEGNEIKAYYAMCETQVDEFGFCDRPDFPLGITTYTVSYNSQRVISDNGGIVHKYANCTVKDRKNWTCSYDDESGNFGFVSGTYFNIPNWEKVLSKTSLEKAYYPSRSDYIDLRIKAGGGCKGYYPICYFLTAITN